MAGREHVIKFHWPIGETYHYSMRDTILDRLEPVYARLIIRTLSTELFLFYFHVLPIFTELADFHLIAGSINA